MFYFQTDERLHTAALCAEKIHELFAVKYLKSIDFTPPMVTFGCAYPQMCLSANSTIGGKASEKKTFCSGNVTVAAAGTVSNRLCS